METTLKRVKRIGLLMGLSLLFSHLYAQNDENFYMIGGVVKNAQNKRAIEYVTVLAVGTHVSTITNEDGEFVNRILQGNSPKRRTLHYGFGGCSKYL